ncbi:MAG: zinc-binding dehydrogenase [Candidatus Eisenbacteria bacterium]|nr:zinc-binding dehydrogenase [Candidatus Eisenbacteria bacterium]
MNAAVMHGHGGPEVLVPGRLPVPAVGPGAVRVDLKAAALNRLDLFTRNGHPSLKLSFPHIPGADGAGVVAEVGADVAGISVGQRVVVSPGLSCGACLDCLSGRDNLCRRYSVLGNRHPGTYCESLVLPAANVLPLPDRMSFAEGAAAGLVFLTAWHMLVGRARVRVGETVLVQAAGSGVGMAAIQIAKLFRCRVLTTVSSPEKAARARELGADECIDYRAADFREEVMRLTAKAGVDVVIEHVGGEVFEKSVLSLARNGRLVTCGNTVGPTAGISTAHLFTRHLAVLGSYMGSKAELIEVMKFLGDGSLRAVIDSEFPLARAADAHRRLEGREGFGKVVLEIGG